jgi:antitoxin PrlF
VTNAGTTSCQYRGNRTALIPGGTLCLRRLREQITTKGQVTIPVEVRQKLGIETGTRVEFVERSDGTWEFAAVTGSILDLRGMFKWSGPAATLEDMDDAIAAGAAESMNLHEDFDS